METTMKAENQNFVNFIDTKIRLKNFWLSGKKFCKNISLANNFSKKFDVLPIVFLFTNNK